MLYRRSVPSILSLALLSLLASGVIAAQSRVKSVEITPNNAVAEVGQRLKLSAVAKDESGNVVNEQPSVWFAAPSDLGGVDESGTLTVYAAGEVIVGAMIGGKMGYGKIAVKPAPVIRVEVEPLSAPLVAGGVFKLSATARIASGDPRTGVPVSWSSDDPSIAAVDSAGVVRGLRPGKTVLRAAVDSVSGSVAVEVQPNPVASISLTPPSYSARTGDVVRFRVNAQDNGGAALKTPAVRWSVTGEGALIEEDGAFVAERPGTYVVTATSGNHAAVASVIVSPRNIEREVEVVGRAPHKDVQSAEQWIFNNHAYVSTVSDRVLVYDISDPANVKLTDTVKVDARLVNDISTTSDGKIAVLTREMASDRKNGIVFLDVSNPAHPKVISEYTATVTGGVHSAFIDGHYVYLTDDATGSLRVIDFKDVKNPREVSRFQVENPVATPFMPIGGQVMSGRYLHDVQVKDGLAYLAYWRDGLVILDVGNGVKGGTPEKPQLVSQLRFNYHELYGSGWIAGAHAVYRYKNLVFVGDEVFPAVFDIHSKTRIPIRGIVHVVDVSDITRPRRIAEYVVPEAGAHNIWVEDDVMYMGYYNGGGRIVDVSGELRGDLYRQGREIARVWTGEATGFRPNIPLAWGAQPHGGNIYFIDMNTGLWIVKLGNLKDKGSTTAPGN